MNMNYVHIIKSKDYDHLRRTLDESDLEQDIKERMQEVLYEHKLVTIAAFKKRKQQIDEATGLFAALENKNTLFPEPKPDCEPKEEAESNDAVDPLEPITVD